MLERRDILVLLEEELLVLLVLRFGVFSASDSIVGLDAEVVQFL